MELPKDSGVTRTFTTGAHRDAAVGKGRCDLLPLYEVALVMGDKVIENIDLFKTTRKVEYLAEALKASLETVPQFNRSLANMMLEVSLLYEAGAIKRGENNWKLGMPLKSYIDSGTRHYLKTLRGDTDEPHHRGFVWNLLCAMWTAKNIENAFDDFEVIQTID